MNLIFHFIFNYVFVEFITGMAWDYIIVVFLFSVLIDLTHLPYLLKVRRNVVDRRFGSESRTRFHEMYGLIVFSFILCLAFFFFDIIIISIAALCLVLHFSIDFISGKSMPFYPYSNKEVFLGLMPYGYRNKVVFELFSTLIMGVLFWLRIQSFVL
jgi:hypothetical protein